MKTKIILLLFIIVFIFLSCENRNKITHNQWSQDELEIPFVIREMNPSDVSDSVYVDWIKRKTIVLKEGFTIDPSKDQYNELFDFYCMINVDNSKVWQLGKELMNTLSDQAYMVYGLHGEELNYSSNIPLDTIIKKLDDVENEIINNCFVNIGVVDTFGSVKEVFIDESKFIRYWGSNEPEFRELMRKYELDEFDTLQFVDEFPKVVYEWNYVNKEALSNESLILYLSKI